MLSREKKKSQDKGIESVFMGMDGVERPKKGASYAKIRGTSKSPRQEHTQRAQEAAGMLCPVTNIL